LIALLEFAQTHLCKHQHRGQFYFIEGLLYKAEQELEFYPQVVAAKN